MATETDTVCGHPVLGLVSISCSAGSGVSLQCTGPYSTQKAIPPASNSDIPPFRQPLLLWDVLPSDGQSWYAANH